MCNYFAIYILPLYFFWQIKMHYCTKSLQRRMIIQPELFLYNRKGSFQDNKVGKHQQKNQNLTQGSITKYF